MAEANQPNYGKIGCVMILGIACIVGALIWFGGAGSGKNYVRAETYFNSPVSGLAVGSDVCFRGVKVGTVKRISFIGTEYANYKPEHGSTIWVGMALDPRLCGFTETEDRYVDEMISGERREGKIATFSTLVRKIVLGLAAAVTGLILGAVENVTRQAILRTLEAAKAEIGAANRSEAVAITLRKQLLKL